MLIEVETTTLHKHNLTSDQYILLYLIHKKNHGIINKLMTIKDWDIQHLLKSLIDKGTLFNENEDEEIDFTKLSLRPKYSYLFDLGDYFEEFLKEYPIKVTRSDGNVDYLRNDLKRCKILYKKITNNNREKHLKLVELLKFEIDIREKENSMQFMRRLYKWLITEEWKIFEQRLNDVSIFDKKEEQYGEQLI